MTNHREIELTLMIHRVSANAWQVSDTGDLKDAVWLPKSQCDDGDEAEAGKACEMLVPEWLVMEKGLI